MNKYQTDLLRKVELTNTLVLVGLKYIHRLHTNQAQSLNRLRKVSRHMCRLHFLITMQQKQKLSKFKPKRACSAIPVTKLVSLTAFSVIHSIFFPSSSLCSFFFPSQQVWVLHNIPNPEFTYWVPWAFSSLIHRFQPRQLWAGAEAGHSRERHLTKTSPPAHKQSVYQTFPKALSLRRHLSFVGTLTHADRERHPHFVDE